MTAIQQDLQQQMKQYDADVPNRHDVPGGAAGGDASVGHKVTVPLFSVAP